MPSQFQLRGPSLAALKWQLLNEYGQRARIIRAERIQVGGLFGIGAQTSFEVSVEVDGPPAPRAGAAQLPGGSGRRRAPSPSWPGLSALLAEADAADGPNAPAAKAGAQKSVVKELEAPKSSFEAVLAKLADAGEAAEPAWEPQGNSGIEEPGRGDGILRPSTGAGDLILVLGRRGEPLAVASSMARELKRGGGAELRTAGDHRVEGIDHVLIDRPGVQRAQALAAVANKPLLIAFSLGDRTSSKPDILSSVKPDQVWLVVDAAHKPADTQAWVRQASWFVTPDALAVVGANDTTTPETVNELGIPVGWLDGRAATSATLTARP